MLVITLIILGLFTAWRAKDCFDWTDTEEYAITDEDFTKVLKDVYLEHRKTMFSPLFSELLEEARKNDKEAKANDVND